jgi:PERQ amino acid-rich with GYF domain-containing protein
MARQKEHLAAQQSVNLRSTQLGGIMPNQLQHHSSAHSLHSQPSYGSITSPGGYQPPSAQTAAPGAPVTGLMDNTFRPGVVPGLGPIGPGMDMLGNLREEDVSGMMDRLNLGRAGQQPTFGTAPGSFGQQQSESASHAQQVVAMLSDRARLQREQAEHDAQQRFGPGEQQAAQASADRLQQFNDLRVQTNVENTPRAAPPPEGVIGKPSAPTTESQEQDSEPVTPEASEPQTQDSIQEAEASIPHQEPLSLTEQVQKAASAKQSPQPQSAWKPVEPAIYPFPPAPSQSPLPAPAAQRKPIVAESLAAESRSGAATPAADTPSASIAPWAKEPTEASKGPSLKEIQEAEAKKAAEREAAAAAARREAFEKELLAQTQSPVIQPGLPSSSTWASGTGASPSTPSGAAANASAWAKPATKAPTQQTPASKKTLQQIQKEEEARKNRAAAQAAAAASAVSVATPPASTGKRYADLASKPTPVPVAGAPGSSPWTTVGASGKVKAPGGAASPAPAAIRSTSTSAVPTVVKKPTVTRTPTTVLPGKVNAEEEFRKWAVNELRSDLNKAINGKCTFSLEDQHTDNATAEDFVSSLLSFPADAELITESVHSASHTLDSRHFAEEFLRRRKLAEKGIFDERNTASPAGNQSGGSGWSEVAKKGGQSAQQQQQQQQQQQASLDSGAFKVVPSKKKGKR